MAKKTNIIISAPVTIPTEGNHVNGHSKATVRLSDGKVYPSMFDAADDNGMHQPSMSKRVKQKNGFCLLSDLKDDPTILLARVSELSSVADKAKQWDALQAEQEAALKAEQERAERIAQLTQKLDRRKKIASRKADEAAKANARVAEIQAELDALLNNGN